MSAAPRLQRRPWDTVLHRALSKGVPTFFAAAAHRERDVPKFVERELNGYLDCGHYERGCAKVTCLRCDHGYIVGFSCCLQ